MSWTDERVAMLRKLWGDGRTAAEIAKALGNGFTRNAVIGKAHRLKLSSRLSPVPSVPVRTKAHDATPHVNRRPANHAPRVKASSVAQVARVIQTKNVNMFDLKERMCRWPLGDPKEPGFSFCGCNTVAGLPYCEDHAMMAYQINKRSRLFNPDDVGTEEVDDELIKSVLAG